MRASDSKPRKIYRRTLPMLLILVKTTQVTDLIMAVNDSASIKPRTERDFIHDLATPVSVALGQIEAALDEGRANGSLNESQQNRLAKAQKSLAKIRDLMITRRNEITASST
jgi:hypothetical protein